MIRCAKMAARFWRCAPPFSGHLETKTKGGSQDPPSGRRLLQDFTKERYESIITRQDLSSLALSIRGHYNTSATNGSKRVFSGGHPVILFSIFVSFTTMWSCEISRIWAEYRKRAINMAENCRAETTQGCCNRYHSSPHFSMYVFECRILRVANAFCVLTQMSF